MSTRSELSPARVRQERFARWTIVIFVAASLFSLVTLPVTRAPGAQGWVDVLSDVTNVPLVHTVFGVVVLFLLTGALLRRKRFGLWIVIAVQAAGIVFALATAGRAVSLYRIRLWTALPVDTGDQLAAYCGGVFGVAAVIALLWSRPAFPARRSPGTRGRTLLTLVIGMSISLAVAIALAETFGTTGRHSWGPVVLGMRAALDLDALLPPPTAAPHLPAWVMTVTSALSAIVLVTATAVFLRSDRGHRDTDPANELAVRRLLAATAVGDSLGYFATRRDKLVITSPDGRAAICYRVIASVSLASADPIGERAAWPEAINAWLTEARTYGWVPAALSPGRAAAQAYVNAGLKVIPLGDEAIVDVSTFTLDGPAMKPVRQSVVRVRRAGYTVVIRRHRDIDPSEMSELATLAELWRGDAPERGFSMALSRLGDPADGGCLMVLAHRPDGRPAGLLSLAPWGRTGVSLDLMRRDPESVNGVIELMVTTLVERSPEFGVQQVSLNFAMFRAVFAGAEEFGAGPVTKLNDAVLGVFSRFFQLESLYRSNAKYRPAWVTRYLCVDSALSLPRVAMAAGMAEGFLPQLPRRRAPVDRALPPWFLSAVTDLEETRLVVEPTSPAIRTDQERSRRERLGTLDAAGMTGYPVSVPRTGPLPEVLQQPAGTSASVTGRVQNVRDFGGVLFAVLAAEGAGLQVVLDRAETGAGPIDLWRRTVDRGDIVGVTGVLGNSKSGERSLIVADWRMAAKCLRPLPVPGAVLADPEARVRDRSADLIVNAGSAAMISTRSTAVAALRSAFQSRGFREVETPILQPVHGGATARPFTTHSHAYSRTVSLRIAPELFLKRLIVGGSGPIFELGRNFRNEGADATHNPEFTALEAYLPYSDYQCMRAITEQVICEVAMAIHGAPIAMRPTGDGQLAPVDLSAPWPVLSVHAAVGLACRQHIDPGTSADRLQEIATACDVLAPDGMTAGEVVILLYENLVEPATVTPVFYTDFPVEDSPLSRPHRLDPRLSERWDLVAFGMEIGTAYSELTDPIEQRARLTEQSLRAAAGDGTAMEVDEDFLAALELGMPPTGGLGLGVDRIVMMLTGSSIRSVLTFPFVRPLHRG